MQLQRALRLHSDFGTERKDAVAFVGAGGKTTAMFRLARELAAPSVIVAATTHLGAWQIPLADRHVIAESAGEIREIPAGVTLVTGRVEGDRTQSVSASALFWLREEAQSRGIPLLIEADGARQKPLKAPAAHEPPIPDFAETVVLVAGLSGLGKPITEESVFRAEKFRELSGAAEGESVTPEILRRVLTHPEGGLKNIPTRSHWRETSAGVAGSIRRGDRRLGAARRLPRVRADGGDRFGGGRIDALRSAQAIAGLEGRTVRETNRRDRAGRGTRAGGRRDGVERGGGRGRGPRPGCADRPQRGLAKRTGEFHRRGSRGAA
ncbi:MAG: putative selenium-dependent hydroxylase accessory protein YqeC [Anaerolineae bacterium]|nr:MAG: putative selenium-dependent hydroxylase accessory protein YqeC [Anaerolineae bacterium]